MTFVARLKDSRTLVLSADGPQYSKGASLTSGPQVRCGEGQATFRPHKGTEDVNVKDVGAEDVDAEDVNVGRKVGGAGPGPVPSSRGGSNMTLGATL